MLTPRPKPTSKLVSAQTHGMPTKPFIMTAIRVETTVNAQASCTSLLGHSAGLDLQPHGKSNYIMTQRVRDSGLAYEVQNLKHSRRSRRCSSSSWHKSSFDVLSTGGFRTFQANCACNASLGQSRGIFGGSLRLGFGQETCSILLPGTMLELRILGVKNFA